MDINAMGGRDDVWEVIKEHYLFVCVYVSAYRALVFNIPDVRIEFGFIKHGCVFPSSHLGLPYTLVTNKINTIKKDN